MEPLVEIKHIGMSFGGLTVLQDISLSLSGGTISALFGENGCGKTTLFHIIAGFQPASHGMISYRGKDIGGQGPVAIAKLGIGRLWQTPRVFKNLSTEDNLLAAWPDHPGEVLWNHLLRPAAVRRNEKAAKAEAINVLEEVGLTDKAGTVAGALSFGQQKLLSVGMLLMNGAEVLLMDEPFAGVNALMIDHISQTLLRLREKGRTICLIEHNRAKARVIADHTYMLSKGHITMED
jgi:ABC-type branched-subunit amino acid transport system ATPase component